MAEGLAEAGASLMRATEQWLGRARTFGPASRRRNGLRRLRSQEVQAVVTGRWRSMENRHPDQQRRHRLGRRPERCLSTSGKVIDTNLTEIFLAGRRESSSSSAASSTSHRSMIGSVSTSHWAAMRPAKPACRLTRELPTWPAAVSASTRSHPATSTRAWPIRRLYAEPQIKATSPIPAGTRGAQRRRVFCLRCLQLHHRQSIVVDADGRSHRELFEPSSPAASRSAHFSSKHIYPNEAIPTDYRTLRVTAIPKS